MSGVSEDNAAATSYSASSSGRITHGAAVVITERLAELPDLALPSSLYKEAARAPPTADILAYLQALLQKDPAAFLARYGGVLQSQELNHFEALRSADFEVDHWLSFYAAQRIAAADQAANPRRLPARVKNRRLAAMRRLAAQGEYFGDEAMRHRAPLLYHQQIGRFDEQLEQQPQQQQATAAAVTAAAAAAATERDAAGSGEPAAAGPAGPSGGGGGGLGGSCLATALRQALQTRDDSSPDAAASKGDPGLAAAASATIAGGGGSEGPPGLRPVATGSHPPAAAGPSRAAEVHVHGAAGTGMDVDEMEGAAPGPSGRPAAGSAGGGGGGVSGRPVGRSDLLFSEFLMRQDDEAQLVRRRMQEQQEEDAQMSEHDSDEDDEDEVEDDDDDEQEEGRPEGDRGDQGDGGMGGPSPASCRRGSGHHRGRGFSASDRAQMRRDFVSEMQGRFLLGQDGQYVDYGAIDADASLDGDWLEQESRDAEEKYFDED